MKGAKNYRATVGWFAKIFSAESFVKSAKKILNFSLDKRISQIAGLEEEEEKTQ